MTTGIRTHRFQVLVDRQVVQVAQIVLRDAEDLVVAVGNKAGLGVDRRQRHRR